jgi:hypothetical protein
MSLYQSGYSPVRGARVEDVMRAASVVSVAVFFILTVSCNQPASSERTKIQTTSPAPSAPPSDTAVTPLPVSGAFLVDADLVPTEGYKLNTKTSDEVLTTLNQTSVFYNNQPKAQAPLPTNITGCLSELDTTTIDANKVSAKIIKNLDVSNCVKQLTDPRLTINSLTATLKVYMYLSCSSGDVSGLKGKSFTSLQDIVLGKTGCKEGTFHLQFLSEQTAEVNYGIIPTTFKRRVVSLDGTNALTGCKFSVNNNIETRADDCINFAKDDYSFITPSATLSYYDIYKYKFLGVTSDASSDDNIWRSTGKIELSVDSWTGVVSFTGANTSPTYALQDSASNAAVTGSLKVAAPGAELLTPSLVGLK